MHRSLKTILFYFGVVFFIMPSLAFAAEPSSVGQWQLLGLFDKGGAMM